MEVAIYWGYACALDLSERGAIHQRLLEQCGQQEAEFLKVMNRLSPEDRKAVEDYFTTWKALEYTNAQLAYELGLKKGKGK